MKKIVKTTSGEYLLQYASGDELMNIPDGTDAQPFIDMLESVRKTGGYHYPTYDLASLAVQREVKKLQDKYHEATVYIVRTDAGYVSVEEQGLALLGTVTIGYIERKYSYDIIEALRIAEKTGETSKPQAGIYTDYFAKQIEAVARRHHPPVVDIVRTPAGLYLIEPKRGAGNIPNSTFVVAIEAEHAPAAVKLLTAARALEPKLRALGGQWNIANEVKSVFKIGSL